MIIFFFSREPTSKGTYWITSTIYGGLAAVVTVGLSSTPPRNNNSSSSISTKGPIAAVDDCVRFPLAPLTSRACLLGVSTSSPSNSTTSQISSSNGTPAGSTSTSTSCSSYSSGSTDATFRFPRPELHHDASPSFVSGVSLPSRGQRFEEDNEEYDFEEVAMHPSRHGLTRRRGVSVGTNTSDHRAEQQQQWHQVVSSRRAAGADIAGQRPPRRQQLAGLNQPFRGTPDIDERSSSPIRPCSPLTGPHTGSKCNGSNSNINSNSYNGGGCGDRFLNTYTTKTGAARYCNEQPVKLLDMSRNNGVVPNRGGLYSKNDVSSSGAGAGAVGNNNANDNTEPTFPRCPRCQKDYACLSNQQRCMASHSKRGKQARHPAIASTTQLTSFWDGLTKEERGDIIDYSSIPEATNAFYVLYAGLQGSKQPSSSVYPTAADPVSQLENAGKELINTLKANDKISEISGEKFLKVLEDAAEGTLLLGSANSGSKDAGSHNAICPSPPSFLESTVFLGSVLGARLITALKAEQKRKSELAYWELEAALVAEEQEAEEQKKKKTKKKNNNKKKNVDKKKASSDASKTTNAAGDDAFAKVEKEENVVAAVNLEEEVLEVEGKEKKKEKDGVSVSVPRLQRPVFDSCLDETEVAVGKGDELDEDREVLENGTIQVEDSVNGLIDAAEVATTAADMIKIINTDGVDQVKEEEDEEEEEIKVVPSSMDDDAVPVKKLAVLVSKEADSDSFIVNFGDDNEQRERVEEEPVAVADAAVVVKKIERKGKAKRMVAATAASGTVPDASPVVLESEQQPQPQQLTKAQRRRLSAKRKKAQQQAELIPGDNTTPRAVVLPTRNTTNTLMPLSAAVEQPPVPPMQQQQGKLTIEKNDRHQQQQADPEPVIKEQSALVPEILVAPDEVTVKEETGEIKNKSSPSIMATATPAEPAAEPAMAAYYDGYGGPGYQSMGHYPPLIAPCNPMYAHHAYPTHLQHPPPVDANDSAGVGAVLPLPPPGVLAAPYRPCGGPYMMPPLHLHPGMKHQFSVHPLGLPVMGTPAGAIGTDATDGRIAAAPSSPLPNGVALGVPVEYEQQYTPQRLKDQEEQQQQQQRREGLMAAAVEKLEDGQDEDNDRFKEMMWEAQLRSVNNDIPLLRRLTAQLHKMAAGEVSSSSNANTKVSTKHATFDVEAAKRYFKRRSREIIEGNNTVAATESKPIVVAPQHPPPAPIAAVAKTVPSTSSFSARVAVPPPKNPYLHAALSRTSNNNTVKSIDSSRSPNDAYDRPTPKKKVRGPRRKSTNLGGISGAFNGVEATAMAVNNTASNTGSEGHRAAHPIFPPAAAAAGGSGSGSGSGSNGNIKRFSPSRHTASKNCSNGYTIIDNRRRNNNNNDSNAAITFVHANQRLQELSSVERQQQPRSFLAAAASSPPGFPNLDVRLKSNSNSSRNINDNGSRPPVHGPQKAGEWKIQAHA